MNNRFDTPQESSRAPIPHDLSLVTPEVAASRKALDAFVIPGHAHDAPEYRVLSQKSREEQIAQLGAEVARQVIARHSSVIPRRPTF